MADSHELQRVRRRLLAAAPASAGAEARQALDALTALKAEARRTQREAAPPKSRQYELLPR